MVVDPEGVKALFQYSATGLRRWDPVGLAVVRLFVATNGSWDLQ